MTRNKFERPGRRTRCYVAGPMRDYPCFNFDAFDSLTTYLLRTHDWVVINPADHDRAVYPDIEDWPGFANGDIDRCPKFSFADAMRWDLAQITDCQAIFLLPDWQFSAGAQIEKTVADACGVEVRYAYPRKYGRWLISGLPYDTREEYAPPFPKPLVTNEDIVAAAKPGETRVTSATGGEKGAKDCELGRLPSSILDVAKHFTAGARKYPDKKPGVPNWSLGYDWSLSYNALQRHLTAWWYGEDLDPELGNSHLAAVAFHALVLMDFQRRALGTDDRQKD